MDKRKELKIKKNEKVVNSENQNENLCNGVILKKIKAKNAKTIADAENQDSNSSKSIGNSFRRTRASKYVSNTSIYRHVVDKIEKPELNKMLNQSDVGSLLMEVKH